MFTLYKVAGKVVYISSTLILTVQVHQTQTGLSHWLIKYLSPLLFVLDPACFAAASKVLLLRQTASHGREKIIKQ